MAQKTDVYLIDDLTDEVLYDEPGETIQFTYNGQPLEFDASAKTAAEYRESMSRFVAVARKQKSGKSKSKSKKSSSSTVEREANAAIRDRARDAGVKVSEKGRISNEIRAQFSNA